MSSSNGRSERTSREATPATAADSSEAALGETISVEAGGEAALGETLSAEVAGDPASSGAVTAARPGAADALSETISVEEAATDAALGETITARRTTRAGAAVDPSVVPGRGATLGRFVVLETLGQGGFGVVLAAYDPDLDRKVALKVLHPRLFQWMSADDARRRLLREARSLARLSHPNVVAVHEIGTLDDAVFIAMEFVPGTTLRAWLAHQRPTCAQILEVFAAAGRGLVAAHRAGIVHRDFKPDNVMIAADGRVRVLDFGLARAASEEAGARPAARHDAAPGRDLDLVVTRAGAVLGTPAYMAPEQHRGLPADPRTDQFSFCVALYEALYGARPFAGDTLPALSAAVIAGELRRPPAAAQVPPSIERAVLRGLATDPNDRHPGMSALLEALEPSPRREAEDLLVGRWDERVRRGVRDAFAAAGTEGAAAVGARVEGLLTRYAGAWATAYAEARAAQSGEGAGGAAHTRAAWLLARLDELEALAAVLGEADATVVDHAIEACHQLTPLDQEARAAAPPPPADPATGAAVARLRLRLSRARKLADAGKYARALELAREAADEAASVDYAPVRAEALALLGEHAARAGDDAGAEAALWEAFLGAEACGHDGLRADVACAFVALIGDTRARPEEGKRWARIALAVAARVGAAELDLGRIALALARVLRRNGEYAAARHEAERAVAAVEAALGPEHPHLAEALTVLGHILRELGAWEAADAELQRALALRERALGSEHPHLAESLTALGTLHALRGGYDTALAYHLRACAVAEAALAPDHAALAAYLENLGEAYSLRGRHRDAVVPLERALALREASFGADHPDTAYSLHHLGRVMRAMGRYDEARDHYDRALAVRRVALGDDHPEVAACHNNLGMVLMSLGDHAGARHHHRAALIIREARLGPDHPVTANSHTNVGRASLALGRLDEARRHLDRAVAIWEPSAHHFLSYALAALGSLAHLEGDHAGAAAHFARALHIRTAALGPDHPSIPEILRPQAALHLALGDRASAVAALERAAEILAAAHDADHPELAACRAELAHARAS